MNRKAGAGRKKGTATPIPLWWAQVVREAIKKSGKSQSDIAKMVIVPGESKPMSEPMLSQILNGKSGGSTYIPYLAKILEIDPPMIEFKDRLDHKWYVAGKRIRADLGDEQTQAFVEDLGHWTANTKEDLAKARRRLFKVGNGKKKKGGGTGS